MAKTMYQRHPCGGGPKKGRLAAECRMRECLCPLSPKSKQRPLSGPPIRLNRLLSSSSTTTTAIFKKGALRSGGAELHLSTSLAPVRGAYGWTRWGLVSLKSYARPSTLLLLDHLYFFKTLLLLLLLLLLLHLPDSTYNSKNIISPARLTSSHRVGWSDAPSLKKNISPLPSDLKSLGGVEQRTTNDQHRRPEPFFPNEPSSTTTIGHRGGAPRQKH